MLDNKLSPPELLKLKSHHLRGDLKTELDKEVPRLSNEADQLIKFHGMYQQKSRDPQTEKKHVLMVRGRIPGGRLTAKQWLVWNDLADRFGKEGLRITTRQALQLHGVLIGDAKKVAQGLHSVLATSSGACGDVVRNVTQAINPWGNSKLKQLDAIVDSLADQFKIRSQAYAEIFLDDEPIGKSAEPIYGDNYLPRKFKIAITTEGNNSVDVFTNDLGFAATFEENKLTGFHVFAGGGMGMSHNRPETFPRLADHLGWIEKKALLPIAKAAVATQKEFGDRNNRKHARLKYTIEDRGIRWFQNELQERSGHSLSRRHLPQWNTPNYIGWSRYQKNLYSLGIHVPSGRVHGALKSALAAIVQTIKPRIQLTTDQDLILLAIKESDKPRIERILRKYNLQTQSSSQIFDRALACVALPMCGKALAEGERIYPKLLSEMDRSLAKYKLSQKAPIVRITGCPNGCARPYAAEIGIVGQRPDHYALYVGGSREGNRLAFSLLQNVPLTHLPIILEHLFEVWANYGFAKESFGDFSTRWPRQQLLEATKLARPTSIGNSE